MKTTIRRAAIVLTIMSLMTTSAFAGTITTQDNQNVPQMKVQLEKQAEKSSLAEDKILAIGTDANERIIMEIEKAVAKADAAKNQAQIDAIIKNLLNKTEQITAVAISKIEKLGGEATCEFVEVEIGGTTILVDPLRIVRLR